MSAINFGNQNIVQEYVVSYGRFSAILAQYRNYMTLRDIRKIQFSFIRSDKWLIIINTCRYVC